jgi:hypothetical protein
MENKEHNVILPNDDKIIFLNLKCFGKERKNKKIDKTTQKESRSQRGSYFVKIYKCNLDTREITFVNLFI